MSDLVVREHVALAEKTTLRVGGAARAYTEAFGTDAVVQVAAYARARRWPVFVLGGGSNLVVHDDGVAALVLRLTDARMQFFEGPQGTVEVVAGAGAGWDALVAACCARGLWGIESLSGIPGRVGAAPVQNIGAYGQELADTLTEVEVVPLQGGPPEVWPAAAMALGYRSSRLRATPGRHAVTQIRLRLHAAAQAHGRGPAAAHGASDPMGVRREVLATREQKGMLWHDAAEQPGNVGSFFVNPVVSAAWANRATGTWPTMPQYPVDGGVKLAAGWLIEQAGLARGHVFAEVGGRVGLSPRHALSLCNVGGASAADVLLAARLVAERVQRVFGVALAPEARFVGFWPDAPESAQAWPP